jgi:hypothetical protein
VLAHTHCRMYCSVHYNPNVIYITPSQAKSKPLSDTIYRSSIPLRLYHTRVRTEASDLRLSIRIGLSNDSGILVAVVAFALSASALSRGFTLLATLLTPSSKERMIVDAYRQGRSGGCGRRRQCLISYYHVVPKYLVCCLRRPTCTASVHPPHRKKRRKMKMSRLCYTERRKDRLSMAKSRA